MVAFTGSILAHGQLPATKAALLTAGEGATVFVRQIVLHNTAATTETAVVYLLPDGGTSKVLFRAVLEQNETAVWAEPVVLGGGDAIEGVTTNATSVDYTMTGGG
jgi:hypothetical protein